MKTLLGNLLKLIAYAAASFVILLAIAVGLFRLFLPRLPEYQDDIKRWASNAIGMEVEFSGMDARWGLSGPQLEFYDTELIRPDSGARVVAAEVVGVGIAVDRLVFDQQLQVSRIFIRGTSLEVRQLEEGDWWVQGSRPAELFGQRYVAAQRPGEVDLVAEDVEVRLLQPGDERPHRFRVPRLHFSKDANRIAIDTDVRLPDSLGRDLDLSATRLLTLPEAERSWDITVEATEIDLAGWFELQLPVAAKVLSGTGDVDVSLAWNAQGLSHATLEAELSGLALEEDTLFDLEGRFEYDRSADGWLAAAQGLRIATADGEWPAASVRAETGLDRDGRVDMLDLRATYVDLGDLMLALPVLPDDWRDRLLAAAPSGIVRDLEATVSNIHSGEPAYDISADLENGGFAAAGKRPGVRNFSGQVRANRGGGRLEIDAAELILDLPLYLDEPVDIGAATGTVLWRSSGDRTTVLSDSIRIVNPVLESRSNVHLTLHGDGRSPEIDLAGSWSINDVTAARRYLPRKVMKPKLYNWFQGAVQSGSIPRGTVRLNGALDRFPFDDGGGRFLLEGSVRGLDLKYQPRWPAAENADLELVLDNTRLYSVRNRSLHAGNQVVDAQIEIADLRNPVLTIDAFVTGTLEALQQFSLQSPINGLVGGHLERLSITGDASLRLDLTVPLRRAKETELTAVLRSNSGMLAIEGFAPPITDLIGEVTITRTQITSEVLGGRFLGQDVTLRITPAEDPRFFAVAHGRGMATAEAIVGELGLPLEGLLEGATTYETRILFPRGRQEPPVPLTIEIDTDLEGLAVTMPEPLAKAAERALAVRGDLRFLPAGAGLASSGVAENELAWNIGFGRNEGAWDFDRGVVTLGGGALEEAETRGLHIRGRASTARLEEWLSLTRSGEQKIGAAERIRSVDVVVDNLFAIGQHLRGHHVRVDRSARDWLVQVDGEDVRGSVFVPYDFGSERAMVLEMERLRLPGDDVSPPDESQLDPRKLPPITLKAAEFALADRYFGAVEAQLDRTANGLETSILTATDDTFTIVASGHWVADAADPFGSRTEFTASLNSTDIETTMRRLNFAPGITGDSMNILMNLSFSGGPRADFLDELDGNVQLRFENGQVEEVDPGAGRMFGLFSFVALPRRLSLDFRDVFNKGFGFDSIAGAFRLDDGVAYTCDLSMEGPAANIGIVGRADLAARDYEQAAVISANVGNTLPIVGAVVGGPPGAAAMLIFSQIFRKPLQEVGQVYYGISGSWDEPQIEATNSAGFVRHGEMAGCLAEAQE